MERGLAPNRLVPKFRTLVDDYRALLPVIQVRARLVRALGLCAAAHAPIIHMRTASASTTPQAHARAPVCSGRWC